MLVSEIHPHSQLYPMMRRKQTLGRHIAYELRMTGGKVVEWYMTWGRCYEETNSTVAIYPVISNPPSLNFHSLATLFTFYLFYLLLIY
jgi:hypothetical protein